jgi:hypothetical protein
VWAGKSGFWFSSKDLEKNIPNARVGLFVVPDRNKTRGKFEQFYFVT